MSHKKEIQSARTLRVLTVIGVLALILIAAVFFKPTEPIRSVADDDSSPSSFPMSEDGSRTDVAEPGIPEVGEDLADKPSATEDKPLLVPKQPSEVRPAQQDTKRTEIAAQAVNRNQPESEPRVGADEKIAAQKETAQDVLADPTVDWKNPEQRTRAVARMKAAEDRELLRAQQIALQLGKPLREELPNGKIRELVGLDVDGSLLYVETRNANAAISSAADLVYSSPYNLDGSNVVVGVWDGGAVLATHQEFQTGSGSRVTVRDGYATLSSHAAHVAGTVAAAGVVSTAKGMSPSSLVDSYHWTSDDSEMIAAAATAPGQTNMLVISNHSYGFSRGWSGNEWRGTGIDQNAYASQFGQYSSKARSWDLISYNSPYYLIFHSAGNDNTDNPSNGSQVIIGGNTVTYDSSIHPPGDGLYRNTTTNSANGYENIGDQANSKNIMVVGAANDAVTSGLRDPSKSTLTGFSSRGPTDDGRIKPDIVANGASLYSTHSTGDTAYTTMSGTSMSGPSAAGSAALLVHHYRNLFPGGDMHASTLKGLILHTATDIGNPGPDYHFGWGLINVKTAADVIIDHHADPLKGRMVEDQLNTTVTNKTFFYNWDGSSPIRATICWTDPAAASTTSHDLRTKRLVNDLDIRIVAPDGTTQYYPFVMPYVGTWTVASMSAHATTGINSTDNVEQILITNPGQLGQWRIEVTHKGTLTNNLQNFSLITSGLAAGPAEMTVARGATAVSVGGSDVVNGTSSSTGTQLTYTITNVGGNPLQLTTPVTISGQSNCSVTVNTQPSSPVAATASTNLVLTVTPGAGGWSFNVSIPNNDTESNPYHWTVGGVADSATLPVMAITGSQGGISNGGSESVSGSIAGVASQLTYSIANLGNANLTLTTPITVTPVTNCSISVTTQPTSPVAASGSTNLVLNVTPTAAGSWSATVSIANNDPSRNPYTWTISGSALSSYTVTYNGNNSDSGTAPVDAGSPYVEGATVTVLGNTGNLTRNGFTFAGWNTAANGSGTTYQPGATFSITASNVTLHAQWNSPPIVEAGDPQVVYLQGATPWSPSGITTLAWYDAADSTTITAPGGAVSQWNDKSGYSRNINQTTAGFQPTHASNTVSFDGIDDYLWNENPFMYDNNQIDIFVVAGIAPTNDDRLLSEGSTTSNNPLYCIAQTHNSTASIMSAYIRDNNGAVLRSQPNLSAAGAIDDTRKIYQWKDTGSQVSGRVNGGTETTSAYSRSGILTMNRFSMGAVLRAGTVAHINADVNEIVICNNLSNADREKMEGYLAHKWGLAANLPAAHPYKDTAPGSPTAVAALNGSVSDPDGDPVTRQWTKAAGPAADVGFDDATVVNTNAYFTEIGTYTLRLTADDGFSQPHDEVTITVNPQTEGRSLTYTGNGNSSGEAPVDPLSPYQDGTTVTVLGSGNLVKTDHSFAGWNTSADGNGTPYAAGATFTINANTTLHAQWAPNTFGIWIGGFSGLGGLTALGDDPDGDGIKNGIENFFGTHPGEFSRGITAGEVTRNGNTTLTFTHPLNGSPAGNLSAAYRWSKDLSSFHGDGVAFEGTTVTFVRGAPVDGIVTVTATVTGTQVERLFVDIAVSEN